MLCFFFFFKQKTAYELRISDWSSDACSSDLQRHQGTGGALRSRHLAVAGGARVVCRLDDPRAVVALSLPGGSGLGDRDDFPFLGSRRQRAGAQIADRRAAYRAGERAIPAASACGGGGLLADSAESRRGKTWY